MRTPQTLRNFDGMASPPSHSPFLSISGSAELIGVTEKTIRNWISAGTLPAYRVGGRTIRIRRTDVEALFRPIPTAGAS